MNFNALVVKVASRCNLNCSYCFMYNLGDETYKLQPKFMQEETVDNILTRTKNYIKKYDRKYFAFLFHGGEPLLMKPSFFISFCEKVNAMKEEIPGVRVEFRVQTNGVLIDKQWCDLFKKYHVNVGISIDGAEKAHDMYRKDHAGNGSYESVIRGAKLLKKELGYLNLVSVINVQESVKENYEAFSSLEASSINYLLTDYTHDNYPYSPESNETPTADWLIELFDIWVQDTTKRFIPFFSGMINILLGRNHTDDIEVTSLVVETNGQIEVIDSMKACGNAFTKNHLNIKTNDLSDIMDTTLGRLYFKDGINKLSEKCQKCPISAICKGGRLVHRYSNENGFNNPSVYCKDLVKIIAHIQGHLIERFSDLYAEEDVARIDAEEVITYLDNLVLDDRKEEAIYQELENF
ncbi:MAG: radical SAM protein [Cyclobacteriaceae bacterium]